MAYSDGKERPASNLMTYGLKDLQGSDYVSVNDINNNFQVINDKLSMAYVNAEGEQGNWWYMRYTNGRVFFGIDDYAYGDIALSAKWDDYYSSVTLTLPGNFPVAMKSTPYMHIELISYDVQDSINHSWRFLVTNVDASNEYGIGNGGIKPNPFCVYWWPPASMTNKGSTVLKNVHFSVFGVGRVA